ncbi:LysR family transcriptional regulator [Caenimonas sedimenti]|uniref:LysR family transcriptional regulator n=1 Tax=Caenimonas sedimenti TaxID=2596921 RepID=A0A562ZQ35_9BURK|nr:LysR family transcriptional regulator [Caenimonas sedimenti]TWO70689.1 LysR family transcriptional regulator [Caenimonas sedimenti]
MPSRVLPADLGFFALLAASGSLSATAREQGLTTAAVSKRLSQMEARLGLPLVNRTTRRMSLTAEGEIYLEHAQRILGELDEMDQLLGQSKSTPSGLLRVNATLGFGRIHVGPVISRFGRKYPRVEVRLQLSVDPPPLTEDAFDVCIRFGPPPDARVIARMIAPNRRLLCAAPSYLARHGEPKSPTELAGHNFISIRQGEEAYGVLRLTRGRAGKPENIKVRGSLTTNDGEIAVSWALDGHGILLRAEWDIERYLRNGRLVALLPQYSAPNADIYAVYPQRHQATARVRAFVDFMAQSLGRSATPG